MSRDEPQDETGGGTPEDPAEDADEPRVGYDDGPAPPEARTAGTEFPHEPEEPDPGAEAENVEFDVTSGEDLVDRLPDPEDVSSDVQRRFWAAALLLNLAIFAVSLGIMLAYFWGWYEEGALLVAIGAVAAIGVYRQIRDFQRSRSDDGD